MRVDFFLSLALSSSLLVIHSRHFTWLVLLGLGSLAGVPLYCALAWVVDWLAELDWVGWVLIHYFVYPRLLWHQKEMVVIFRWALVGRMLML